LATHSKNFGSIVLKYSGSLRKHSKALTNSGFSIFLEGGLISLGGGRATSTAELAAPPVALPGVGWAFRSSTSLPWLEWINIRQAITVISLCNMVVELH
jgi:hypothetical protein